MPETETETRALIVRRLSDRTEVSRVAVTQPTRRGVQQCVAGMLRNMSPDYFVDDSAFDYLYAGPA